MTTADPLLLFLDFDGVLHPLFVVDATTGYAKPYDGRTLLHAPLLVDILRPWLPQLEIVISSTWGRKRDLDALRALLPAELAERVSDAVHHHLLPPALGTTTPITSRYDEIAWYLQHVRPDAGDRWFAIDDDGAGWPEDLIGHLAWCGQDLGNRHSQDAVRSALSFWLPQCPAVRIGHASCDC